MASQSLVFILDSRNKHLLAAEHSPLPGLWKVIHLPSQEHNVDNGTKAHFTGVESEAHTA